MEYYIQSVDTAEVWPGMFRISFSSRTKNDLLTISFDWVHLNRNDAGKVQDFALGKMNKNEPFVLTEIDKIFD